MSKSRRKTSICSICCCDSERISKKIWHSRFRAKQRDFLKSIPLDDEDYVPVLVRDASNPWVMQKDGKQHLSIKRMIRIYKSLYLNMTDEEAEKEAIKVFEKCMRK